MTLPVDVPAVETRPAAKCRSCGHPVPTGVLRQGQGPVCWRKEHDPPLRLPALRRHGRGEAQPDLFDLLKEITEMDHALLDDDPDADARQQHLVAAEQQRVDDWNAAYPVGTPVRYWVGDLDAAGEESCVRAEARLFVGCAPVVWVHGHAGCIALDHVEPLDEKP